MDSIVAFKSNDRHHSRGWLFPFSAFELYRNSMYLFVQKILFFVLGGTNIQCMVEMRAWHRKCFPCKKCCQTQIDALGIWWSYCWFWWWIWMVWWGWEFETTRWCRWLCAWHSVIANVIVKWRSGGRTKWHLTTGWKCWQCLCVENTRCQSSVLCQVYNLKQKRLRPFTAPTLICQLYGKTGSASAGSLAWYSGKTVQQSSG